MTVQIDMSKVASDAAADLGGQIGVITAELHAQRQANELLHAENEELRKRLAASAGEDVTSDSPGVPPAG